MRMNEHLPEHERARRAAVRIGEQARTPEVRRGLLNTLARACGWTDAARMRASVLRVRRAT